MLYGVKMFETLTLSHQKTKLAEEMQRSREGERGREKRLKIMVMTGL